MIARLLAGVLAAIALLPPGPAQSAPTCANHEDQTAVLNEIYHAGDVFGALEGYEELVACPDLSSDQRINLFLHLARVHDRIGLHWNKRPVAESLNYIERAQALAETAGPAGRAQTDLQLARHYYRAETAESGYPQAFHHAETARAAYEDLQDHHGHADAVHLMGLMYMQMRELDKARQFFDLSLALENKSSDVRPWMLADYERHVGFVFQMSGQADDAVPYFIRSFEIRRDNGLTDAAMFAAASLARTLVDLGREAEAREYIDYALRTAQRIDSPEGFIRAGLVQADVYLGKEQWDVAGETLERVLRLAKGIGRTSVIAQVEAQLKDIADLRTPQSSSHEH